MSTDIDGHLNARLVQLDLGNIVPGSPPHSPLDKSARGTNGVSPGRSGGTGPPAGGATSTNTGASNLRSMSDMRKAKFKKLLDQQVGAYSCSRLDAGPEKGSSMLKKACCTAVHYPQGQGELSAGASRASNTGRHPLSRSITQAIWALLDACLLRNWI